MESMANPYAGVGIVAVIFGFILMMVLISVVVGAVICYFVFTLYKAVPARFRQMEPGLVWLLLIPVFNFVWSFFVFPKLSKSYELALQAGGDSSAGNCNASLALAYAICNAAVGVCMFLRTLCLVTPVAIAALVILIIYLVKMFDLKAKLASAPGA
jgi:hypothetical protein